MSDSEDGQGDSTFIVDDVLRMFLIKYVDSMEVYAGKKENENWSYCVVCQVDTEYEPSLSLNFPDLPSDIVFASIKSITSMDESSVQEVENSDDDVELKVEIDDSKSSVLDSLWG